MKHVYQLADAHLTQPSLVTIGVFDGVHRGHQALIKRLVNQAHSNGWLAVVLTFFPHPDVVLRGEQGRYYLTSPEQRAAIMAQLGVDCVVTHPFNEAIRQIRAADFVDQLIEHLKIDAIWVGADFGMGYKREGNVNFLRKQGESKGFSVGVIDLIMHETEGERISSSKIRELLLQGEVDQVRDWLGRGYAVEGEVVHGDKRGRKIGFPTANVAVWSEQVIPASGVYASWVTLDAQRHMAVTNVGVRPTFGGDDVTVETHLLDFEGDLYGKKLQLTFETRLRAERKFNGIEELVAQIKADAQAGRDYLKRATMS